MRFNRFVSSIQDIEMVQKYSERRNYLLGVHLSSLIHLPYVDLKRVLPDLIATGQLEKAILLVLRSKGRKVSGLRLRFTSNYKKLKFLFWIQDQYQVISELETRWLNSPPDSKMVAAGIQELDILGDKNIIDALAKGDVLKWAEVEKLSYERVFDKQLKTVIEARISRKLSKMK